MISKKGRKNIPRPTQQGKFWDPLELTAKPTMDAFKL